jgi:hypothetical protein
MVLKKDAVMVGSCCPGLGTGPFLMGLSLPQPPGADCDVYHSAAPADEAKLAGGNRAALGRR